MGYRFSLLFAAVVAAALVPLQSFLETSRFKDPLCKCLPAEICWPSLKHWAQLNSSVEGRLIATVPLGSPCHDPDYDAARCAELQGSWVWPRDHEASSSSLMSPFWQNASCDPWASESTPCLLGNDVSYSVNVSTVQDAIAGLLFARQNNVRLVVKNTGHDYMGKSTGKGALALWMHHLRSIDVLNYTSSHYNGPAMRMGAGVRGFEAYAEAHKHGLRVVGGFCPSVGIAGGYTQGGGHSPLSSLYGLGADQVLEWEVVTADGNHIVASPSLHQDLFWALSGGGGGTYAVVVSMTVRAHPDGIVGGASLTFPADGLSKDTYWNAFTSWQSLLPSLVDSGATVGYAIFKDFFFALPITAPGRSEAEVHALLEPYTDNLKSLGINYQLSVTSLPTFLDHYHHYLGASEDGAYTIHHLFAGRMIPRSVVETNNAALVATIRNITENTNAFLGFVALDVAEKTGAAAPHAVLPAWRNTLITTLAQSTWNFTAPRSDGIARANELTNVVVPQLTALTPGSGTYMNEADFQLRTWKRDLYGALYPRLRAIKAKYDPEGVFYGITAVGSDAWTLAADGRLCRAPLTWENFSFRELRGRVVRMAGRVVAEARGSGLQGWVEGVGGAMDRVYSRPVPEMEK